MTFNSSHSPTIQMYSSKHLPTWCPGCGDFNIWMAIKQALVNLKVFPYDVLFVFDVGCNGNMSDKIGGYRFHSLHGRTIPFALGAAVANRKVKVIAFGGDGATYGEGVNHLLSAFRMNIDMTLIVHNNGNYGLTTGQTSPTTMKGLKMNGNPEVKEEPLDPIGLAFTMKGGFIAREFSGETQSLVKTFEKALSHNGFSFIDVIQSCPTYDKGRMYSYFEKQKKSISEIEGYDNSNYVKSRDIHFAKENGVTTGVLFQGEDVPTFFDKLNNREGVGNEIVDEVKGYDVSEYLEKFR